MSEQSFNIPQFNSQIDKTLREFIREKEKLENEKDNMSERIHILRWAKEYVTTLEQSLNEAEQRIVSLKETVGDLKMKLLDEQKKNERYDRLGANIFDLSKKNADLTIELTAQREINENLSQQLTDEKHQREELEMKLAEMSKLSASMAKKASEEAMLKALRTYANTSKHKKIDKRIYAKTAILEMAMLNGLTLPPDLAATIDTLDDELAGPKTSVTVNAGGNYNDIHDNDIVNQKQQ